MKAGKSLTELAQEIERRSHAKQDFIAPADKLKATVSQAGEMQLAIGDKETLPIQPHAHGQIADYLKIPKRYYDRMQDHAPELLADSVNRWLIEHGTERRMVRTLDNSVRAILSDRYRALENEDLARAVLPVLSDLGVMVLSAEITDRRFYLKAVDGSIAKDVPSGRHMGDGGHTIFDSINPAITISNSEIGSGALSIETSIFTRACTNLATFGASLKRYHTGSRAELNDEVYALLTDKTKTQTDRAIWMQTRDLVRAAFDEAKFEATVRKLIEAAADTVEAGVVEVIKRTQNKFAMTDTESECVLTHLIKGGDLSRYGLHSAVTRAAEDLSDYDRASEFEKLGGAIIELKPNEWRELARAA